MKQVFSFLFLCTFFLGYTQQQNLSIDDAVLGYYKGLYPSSLQNLKWIDDTNNYVFIADNNLTITNAKTTKVVKTLLLNDIQKAYPELKRFPRVMSISATELTFRSGNSIEIFNYITNSKTETIPFDKAAQNNEFNSKAKATAYTLDNNLFIGTPKNPKISITSIKDKNIVSGQAIHRSEFGISKGTFWSPEGNFLAFYQKDESNVTNYPLVDIN
ncbi:MAG: DPP IV N-terminal domain-containing protein, partial [Lutibacter sp.]|nr:DPP IV N-terminal domain-containing protein [Lutibacter sp.]